MAVSRACQLCQAALRVEGLRVIDLIAADAAALGTLAEDEEESQRWRQALEVRACMGAVACCVVLHARASVSFWCVRVGHG